MIPRCRSEYMACKIRRITVPAFKSLCLGGAEFHGKSPWVPGRFSFIDTFTHQNNAGLPTGARHTRMSRPSPACPPGAYTLAEDMTLYTNKTVFISGQETSKLG